MGRFVTLALAATLLALPGRADDVRLGPAEALTERLTLEERVIPHRREVRLLQSRLRISGVDPDDVARTLEAYNRHSEIAQFTPDGVALAPLLLNRALSLDPGQLLQLRFSGQSAKLVFRMPWE